MNTNLWGSRRPRMTRLRPAAAGLRRGRQRIARMKGDCPRICLLCLFVYSCSFVLCKGGENMGIWEYMKTTIELPEALFRRAKSMAVQEGVTLKQLLTEALESRLDTRRGARNGKAAAPRWMRAYGALQHLRHERKAIERAIESEFEKIEPEDRL